MEQDNFAFGVGPRRGYMATEPPLKRLACKWWKRASAVDADDFFQQPARHTQVRDGRRQRSQRAADLIQELDVGEQTGAQGRAMRLIVVCQELILELGHIDVDRTLTLT